MHPSIKEFIEDERKAWLSCWKGDRKDIPEIVILDFLESSILATYEKTLEMIEIIVRENVDIMYKQAYDGQKGSLYMLRASILRDIETLKQQK